MTPLILLIIAPVILIALSVLRIMDFIALPIGAITFFMMILGCVLSFEGSKIVADCITYKPSEPRCLTGAAAVFIGGSILNIVASSIIGIFGGLTNYFTHKAKSINLSTFKKLSIVKLLSA